MLRRANKEKDPVMRIALVSAAFFILASNTIDRVTKPFNSLLGETYEILEEDFELICEQLSHHPPVSGLYCKTSDFTITSTLFLKTKLSLTAFEIFDYGVTTI